MFFSLHHFRVRPTSGYFRPSPLRDTTSELWTLVLFPSYCYHLFTLLTLFTLLAYYYHFPLDTLIPFVSSKPVRLTTSSQVGNKVLGCVVCKFRVAASNGKLGRGATYKLSEAVAKPVRITFSRIVCSSPDRHTLVS
jgi:hypothetical protein